MENASKALIIAGAILISIVLVSVGVIVVNSLNPDDAVSTMSQQEIQAFNSKFESYTGNAKTGSTVKRLISIVNTNNINYGDDNSKIIGINATQAGLGSSVDFTSGKTKNAKNGTEDCTGYWDSKSLTSIQNGLNSGTRYDVTTIINDNSGLIEMIIIKTH